MKHGFSELGLYMFIQSVRQLCQDFKLFQLSYQFLRIPHSASHLSERTCAAVEVAR